MTDTKKPRQQLLMEAHIDCLFACANATTGRYAYIVSTFFIAKALAWPRLRELAKSQDAKINLSNMEVLLENGSSIRLVSSSNPNSLRGLTFEGIFINESRGTSDERD